jgi:hypothetical protein
LIAEECDIENDVKSSKATTGETLDTLEQVQVPYFVGPSQSINQSINVSQPTSQLLCFISVNQSLR